MVVFAFYKSKKINILNTIVMEASELRIGNKIKDKVTGLIVTIESLERGNFSDEVQFFEEGCRQPIIINEDYYNLRVNCNSCNKFEPIPLAEELLLKAGFYKAEYLEHIFQININGLYFAFDEAFEGEKDENIVGDFDECVTIRIPKYLHQLQNLYFALTGNELEINL